MTLKFTFEQLVKPEQLTSEFEIVFEGVERIVNQDASFECEPDDTHSNKSDTNSVGQLLEEDEIDRLERTYNTCVDIVKFIQEASGTNPERFFVELFRAKLRAKPA